MMTAEVAQALREARALMGVRWECSSYDLIDAIDRWVQELLRPHAAAGHVEATYILWVLSDRTVETEEVFEQQMLEQYTAGAKDGIPDALFHLAHWHWERGEHETAAPLYAQAASAGHAHAKWCYGLDLLSGTGVPKDDAEGLRQIREAAIANFEGAIQFMSNAYAMGQYGFAKDEAEAARWQRRLVAGDVIRY